MMIDIDRQARKPVYEQLLEQFERLILTGVLRPGDQLPSVRSLSLELSVNPNTVQRAFQELEKEGLVYSARTSGRFVTEDEKLIDQKRHEIAQTLMKNFVTEMTAIGFSSPEIKTIITDYIEQTGKDL